MKAKVTPFFLVLSHFIHVHVEFVYLFKQIQLHVVNGQSCMNLLLVDVFSSHPNQSIIRKTITESTNITQGFE